MKIIAWLAGLGTLLAGAFYLVVSLNRWEWNRALFFGLIVLIAEVGLATTVLRRRPPRAQPQRPRRPRRRADPQRDQADARPLRLDARVQRPAQRVHHLPRRRRRAAVGIAWIVDRAAPKTSSPAGEERLAGSSTRSAIPRGCPRRRHRAGPGRPWRRRRPDPPAAAAAGARDEDLAAQARLATIGVAIGIIGVIAPRSATLRRTRRSMRARRCSSCRRARGGEPGQSLDEMVEAQRC